MIRLVSAAAALAGAGLLVPPAVFAQQPASYYVATPETAPAQASFVTRSTVWSCGGGVCVAQKAPDRPQFVCERIAKTVGTLSAFTAGGEALDAEALAKCNERAR